MNAKHLLFLCFFCYPTISGCAADNGSVSPARGTPFAIHVLSDSTLKLANILTMDLADVSLEPQPLFANKDILFYDFSSHVLYLRDPRTALLPKRERDGLFPESWWGRPFIVSLGEKRQYRGVFYSIAQTPQFQVPFIEDLSQYPEDILHIAWIWPRLPDGRNHPDVRDALHREGLLRAGLSLALNDIHILENADTSTVRYTFQLTNEDVDNLYTIDPERMGTELFHFFVNGPILFNEDEAVDFRARYKAIRSPEPFDHWDPAWFTKINKGSVLQRTVVLKGYPRLSKGRYSAQLRYSGPVNIRASQRYLDDGRYWLGPTDSDTINFIIR